MIESERKTQARLRRHRYYEKHKYEIAVKTIEEYFPNTIKRLQKEIPEKMEEYFKKYSYDLYWEKYTKAMLGHYGVGKAKIYYQECYSNTFLGYMYGVGRCAYSGYEGQHVVNYIKKMIRVSIICGINASNEVGHICRENNCRVMYLDDGTHGS